MPCAVALFWHRNCAGKKKRVCFKLSDVERGEGTDLVTIAINYSSKDVRLSFL